MQDVCGHITVIIAIRSQLLIRITGYPQTEKMRPTWQSDNGDIQLWLGDCREILPHIGKVDAVITDPPYGVMLGEVVNGQAKDKKQTAYSNFSDTPEYLESVVVPFIKECIERFHRVVLTPGTRNFWLYPPSNDFGVWFNPAGTSIGKWGFILAQPILFYGKDPRAGKGSGASSTWGGHDSDKSIRNKADGHPCPKPVKFTSWLVNKASLKGETILDPFMGSGTTGIACIRMGRRFRGIEISPEYFEIAKKRIQIELQQQLLPL